VAERRRKEISKERVVLVCLIVSLAVLGFVIWWLWQLIIPAPPEVPVAPPEVPPEVPPEIPPPPPIYIYSDRYTPRELEIRVGQRVTWVNMDVHIHTLESEPFSRTILPGQNFSWTFYEPGQFFFWDGDLGRAMNGTILII
jgi:hypothetical protein